MCARKVKTQADVTIKKLSGMISSTLKRKQAFIHLPPYAVKALNGRYWKNKHVDKIAFLKLQKFMIEDDADSDYHIGDEEFQNSIIGGATIFIDMIGKLMSKNYTKGALFDFPMDLLDRLHVSKSAHKYAALLETVSMYLIDENNPDSRVRRYDIQPEVPIEADSTAQGSDDASL